MDNRILVISLKSCQGETVFIWVETSLKESVELAFFLLCKDTAQRTVTQCLPYHNCVLISCFRESLLNNFRLVSL